MSKLYYLQALVDVHRQALATISRTSHPRNEVMRRAHKAAISALLEQIVESECASAEDRDELDAERQDQEIEWLERHHSKCGCRDCSDDRGDWQYHQRIYK